MGTIEQRIEVPGRQPDYSGYEFSAEEIAKGAHRGFVGGVWDSHGLHQLEFMQRQGLTPDQTFLDVGCGCFRAGRFFVDTLDPGHYYGVDANLSLLQIGYDVELTDEQRERLPIANLRANDRFDVDFGVQFDFAVAQSVFTHVSLNHIRLCLYRVAKVMKPGGVFYATFFERGPSTPLDTILGADKVKPLFTEKNVFWYYRNDLKWAAQFSPWEFRYIGDWGHPRGQKMVAFTRVADESAVAAPPAQRSTGTGPVVRRFVRRGRRWAARRLDPS